MMAIRDRPTASASSGGTALPILRNNAFMAPANSKYRRQEFTRRRVIDLGGVATWIVSREDLILSKLVWSLDSRSEMQLRDVRSLLDESTDWIYLQHWAPLLDVATLLDEARK